MIIVFYKLFVQGKSDESEHSENEDELNQTYNR